jgi:hypothetical protein
VSWHANDPGELPASYDSWKTTDPREPRDPCPECDHESHVRGECDVVIERLPKPQLGRIYCSCSAGHEEEDPDRDHDLRNDEPELFEPDDDYSAYEGQD